MLTSSFFFGSRIMIGTKPLVVVSIGFWVLVGALMACWVLVTFVASVGFLVAADGCLSFCLAVDLLVSLVIALELDDLFWSSFCCWLKFSIIMLLDDESVILCDFGDSLESTRFGSKSSSLSSL